MIRGLKCRGTDYVTSYIMCRAAMSLIRDFAGQSTESTDGVSA